MNGLSMLTVDNRQSNSDMVVKLYVRFGPRPTAVRALFLKARDWIRLETIAPGTYDLRYQDLDSGVIFRSDPFEFTETPEADGTGYDKMTISLYTVVNGKLNREEIGPEDFR